MSITLAKIFPNYRNKIAPFSVKVALWSSHFIMVAYLPAAGPKLHRLYLFAHRWKRPILKDQMIGNRRFHHMNRIVSAQAWALSATTTPNTNTICRLTLKRQGTHISHPPPHFLTMPLLTRYLSQPNETVYWPGFSEILNPHMVHLGIRSCNPETASLILHVWPKNSSAFRN